MATMQDRAQAPDQSGYTGSTVSDKEDSADPAGHDNASDRKFAKSAIDDVSLAGGGPCTDGMFGNVNPDGASLTEGFSTVNIAGRTSDDREGDDQGLPSGQTGGFLGRSMGWER